MLNDVDRIFTNIYGWGDSGLKGAKSRGDWDNTAKLLALGHEEIVERTGEFAQFVACGGPKSIWH